MMKNLERKIVIALETGIGAGSVSLLEDGAELDFLVGKCAVLKSGGILILIDTLLKKNEIQKNEIQKVIVSSGPGSLTGIRIGLAIAKGLKDSLQIEYVEVSLLDALVSQTKFAVDHQQNVISAVYVGREEVYYKEFMVESGNKIAVKKNMQVMNLRKFAEKMIDQLNQRCNSYILTSELISILGNQYNFIKVSENLNLRISANEKATLIGLHGDVVLRLITQPEYLQEYKYI